jgi:F420-dependent oxidoreductase-like protein
VKFGLDVSQHHLQWDDILERVKLAEDAGFDGAWVFDHFKPLYASPTGPSLEAWTLLAGLAAATERIRLGPLVTGMTYRHPSILTTEIVTVDHISNGRVEAAIGAAWFEGEHDELGIEFPSTRVRAELLEEGTQVMRLLMTEDDATFSGKHFRLNNASYNPKPLQQPHPPIWIGARGEQLMLPIVGRQADAWHAWGSVADLQRKWDIVCEHAEKAGRKPADIVRATGLSLSEPWDEVRARIEECADAGWTYLTVSWPSEGRDRLEEFIEQIMPDYTE